MVAFRSLAMQASLGDHLYVDPIAKVVSGRHPYDVTTADDLHHVGKLIYVGRRFFELNVSSVGDKLTFEPSNVVLGHVTNPTNDFRAILYGDQGVVKIRSDESRKAPVPVGSWKLKNYSLDRTGFVSKRSSTKPKAGAFITLDAPSGKNFAIESIRGTIVQPLRRRSMRRSS